MTNPLFTPHRAGELELSNRVAMAPMTRNRATDDAVPTDSMVEYYRQRAGAGLIVTEGTEPSRTGKGYPNTPGIHNEAQIEAWSKVTSAVHAEGGRIVCQVMHCGRMSHPLTQPDGLIPTAPSAVRPAGTIGTPGGEQALVTPRALSTDDIAAVVAEFADAAERATQAGFDGIELHGANGYLIHQFLADNTNLRDDDYGGDPVRRARFAVEVAQACSDRIGPGRVGIRISPAGRFNDIVETDPRATYAALLAQLQPIGLAYVSTVRRQSVDLDDIMAEYRPGTVMVNTGYGHPSELFEMTALLESGVADLVSVGRLFIANPDLLERWQHDLPRAVWDEETFYTQGDRGYTDYPRYDQTLERQIS